MKTLKLLYGTAKTPDGKKKAGDVMDFEDDKAKEQMLSGAWEDITASLKSKEADKSKEPKK